MPDDENKQGSGIKRGGAILSSPATALSSRTASAASSGRPSTATTTTSSSGTTSGATTATTRGAATATGASGRRLGGLGEHPDGEEGVVADVDLGAGSEALGVDTGLGLDRKVHLIDGAKHLVDLADGLLVRIVDHGVELGELLLVGGLAHEELALDAVHGLSQLLDSVRGAIAAATATTAKAATSAAAASKSTAASKSAASSSVAAPVAAT